MALVKCPNALYNVCVFIKLSTAETSARTAVHTYNIHQFLEEILPVKTLIPIQIVERAYLRTTPLLPVDPPEEDSFCKGAPRGIILQLVNSCPHPVSRTLLRPLLFLSLARHPIPFSSFVLSSFSFQFLLFLFSSIKLRQRKERRNKKEKGGGETYTWCPAYRFRNNSTYAKTRTQLFSFQGFSFIEEIA